MEGRTRLPSPANRRLLRGYAISDSSNVKFVGWDNANNLYVWFKSGGVYRYSGVTRQRAVACALAKSVGQYVARRIKPNHDVMRVV